MQFGWNSETEMSNHHGSLKSRTPGRDSTTQHKSISYFFFPFIRFLLPEKKNQEISWWNWMPLSQLKAVGNGFFHQGVQRFGAKATWPQRVSKLRKICEALWNKPRFQASKFWQSDGKLANDSKFFAELGDEAMSWNQVFQGSLARKPRDLYLNPLDHTAWNDKVIPFAVSLLNSELDSITLDFCRRLNGKVEQNRVQKKSHLHGVVLDTSSLFPTQAELSGAEKP